MNRMATRRGETPEADRGVSDPASLRSGERSHPGGPKPEIRDLAVIGDRRTGAVLNRNGAVLWYCPERFDRPSLFAALLDPEGGAWRLDLAAARPAGRR